MESTIEFDTEVMQKVHDNLETLINNLSPKYSTDVSIISELSQNVQSEVITPALQKYIIANEAKSDNIKLLFENINNFLAEQIPSYKKINESGVEGLTEINNRLENLEVD